MGTEFNPKKCKRCGMKTVLSEQEIQKAVSDVISMKGVRLADDSEYERRFAVCLDCEKLEYGSTCMLCGCIMQVRARLADGKCPYPGKGKW